jgi:hypothetical protein
LHIGSAPIELTNRSSYLCGTEVLPHLRPLWSEYEDRWWPRALPAAQRVESGSYNARVRAAAERPYTGARGDAQAPKRNGAEVRP